MTEIDTTVLAEAEVIRAAGTADPPEPAKKAVRKRAPRKKATSAEGAVTSGADGAAGAAAVGDSAVSDDDGASAKKTVRKRASRAKKASDPIVEVATEAVIEAPVVVETPTVPLLGALLFQAPDPAAAPVRRSRRAGAAAGPAQPRAVVDELAGTEVEPDGLDEDRPGSDGARSSAPQDDAQDDTQDDVEAGTETASARKRRRRGGRGRRGRSEGLGADDLGSGEAGQKDTERSGLGESGDEAAVEGDDEDDEGDDAEVGSPSSRRRRRRRRRSGAGEDGAQPAAARSDEVTSIRGSTRLEAKKQRRRDGRDAGRRKPIVTEAEFLARRESVERRMIVRERDGRTQIAVLEDDVLVEHYVANETNASMIGNIYLGRVQNVLPSMEAAFIDIGKGRNAVLYAGEVNWDAAGLDGQPRRIEVALRSGDQVLVQVTKDPMGHKGARLTSQISLPGRYLVYVPRGSMTGISRKLPDTERTRLKKILKAVVPEGAGVIVRTAAEGAAEAELQRDVERLTEQWVEIEKRAKSSSGGSAPKLLHGEPDLTVRVIRDVFNEDFGSLLVSGGAAWDVVQPYLGSVAPDLADRVSRWTTEDDVFAAHRVDEQLAKAMDRKVWLPSGGSLVIDRTEAMTVVDVNTGKFTGAGGNLEETVTRNNLEAAEEMVRQLRLRDIGGIIVVDFIDMVLESNRDLVLRRLLECLGRDRTKHQVAEVTSLGLVQMTRKRVGQGLLEVFSEPCEHCNGRGILLYAEPVSKNDAGSPSSGSPSSGSGGGQGGGASDGGSRGSGRSRGRGRDRAEPAPSTPPPARQPIPAGLVASLTHQPDGVDQPDRAAEQPVPDPVDPVAIETDPVDPVIVEAEPVEVVEAAPPSRPRRRRATAPAGPPAGAQ